MSQPPSAIRVRFRCASVNEGRDRDEIILRPVAADDPKVNACANQDIPYAELRLGIEDEAYRDLVEAGQEYELTIRPTAH